MRDAGNQEPTPSVQPDPLWHPALIELEAAQSVSRFPEKVFSIVLSVSCKQGPDVPTQARLVLFQEKK